MFKHSAPLKVRNSRTVEVNFVSNCGQANIFFFFISISGLGQDQMLKYYNAKRETLVLEYVKQGSV